MDCSNCGTLNPASANFCHQCGRALRPAERPRSFVEWLHAGAQTEGERRQVTVLACDTVGSSLLAERMGPEEFLLLMNRAFEAILAPIFEHGGYLARLEGDGFKAFFGAPEAHEDDPLRAVRAGLGIQAAAHRIASVFEQELAVPDFVVRVGIHTDNVVVGPVGTGDTVEYTAMGIGIVLAARLESIARPGTILISESVHRMVEPYVEVVPLGPTAVKGRSQPVHIFEVVGLRTGAELGQARGVRSPLVGRDVELAILRRAIDHLLAQPGPGTPPGVVGGGARENVPVAQGTRATGSMTRRGSIVHIVGETGVGKSRLMSHVRNQVAVDHPRLVWLDGRAASQGQGAYGVLADLLRCYLGIGVDDRVAEIWAKLRHRVTHLFPPSPADRETDEDAVQLIPQLANMLSLQLDDDDVRWVSDLDPEAQERQMFRALRRLCERLTDDGPLVLALDDLQAADDGVIRLLKDLMPLIEELPVLFIFSFRPELGAICWQLRDLARRAHSQDSVEIALHGLSTADSNQLIENLLENPAGEGLTESVRALIRDRSGGNPLFIEEVIRSLIDREVLQRFDERWGVVGEVPVDYIPETLHGVISARLDRLDPATRRTLQIAAVVGRTFGLRVLQAVTQNGGDLRHHLAHLQRAELIRELRRSTEQEYTFNHALTRQVAYETLLKRQRRDHHRRVAQCIETVYADRLGEQYERLAYHFAAAELWPKALDYHLKFATQAQLRYANGKAAQHFDRAWDIVQSGHAGDDETRRYLFEAQGNLDLLAGDYRQAASRYQAALELARDDAHRARLLRKLGNVYQALGEYEQGKEYLVQGLEIAHAIGTGPELAALYIGLGQIHHRQGNDQRAVELGLQSLEVFESTSDRPGTALASNLLGIAYWAMGDLDTACVYHEKSLSIHASLGDVYGLAASYNNLGRVLVDMDQLERAMANFRHSQQLCLEIGHQHGLATALSHLSELYQRLGQTQEAWACQEKAFEIYNRIGFDGVDVRPEILKMQVW